MVRCTRLDTTLCDKVCQWLVAGQRSSLCNPVSILHQKNWPSRYNWNIVESDVKHHNPNPIILSFIALDRLSNVACCKGYRWYIKGIKSILLESKQKCAKDLLEIKNGIRTKKIERTILFQHSLSLCLLFWNIFIIWIKINMSSLDSHSSSTKKIN